MKVYYTDTFEFPLPEGHRFPVAKYRLLRERIVACGIVSPSELVIAPQASTVDLERVHDAAYVRRVVTGTLDPGEERRMGLPWSPALATRALRSVGATIAAVRSAVEEGHALYLGGGTHHAFADTGAGFCIFNDAPVAIRALQADGRIRRALIVDADVHQGDGTASILADDDSIFTFSIHGERNFPARKQASDLDIALADGTTDGCYLDALCWGLELAFARARPDLVVYLAGADPWEGDRLGRLAVSMEGLWRRDREVLARAAQHGLPVAVLMAGGYARPIEGTVEVQTGTVRIVADAAGRTSRAPLAL